MRNHMIFLVVLIASAQAFNIAGLIGGAIENITGGIVEAASTIIPGLNGPKYWRSGSIGTKETYKYGRFIARIKGDDKKGTVSSFFTYWRGPGWNRGGWSEIDVELVPSSN